MDSEHESLWTTYRVAYGLLIREDRVLLVGNRWRWSRQPGLVWTLPGGRAEPGELVHQALVREFHEETGLTIHAGRLAFVLDVVLPKQRQHFLSLVFEVTETDRSEPSPGLEDDAVAEVRFVPLREAPSALSLFTMREGLATYLANPESSQRYWAYTA